MTLKEYIEKNKDIIDASTKKQGNVEYKILPYLKDIENGVFVEAGALDGLFMSNTKILEDCGWTGLLVEPSPYACEKCLLNRKTPIANCALVSHEFRGEFVMGDFFFDGRDGLGAWSSITRSTYPSPIKMKTRATPLDYLLDAFKIHHIDFFSLDVEGYEMEVLKGIDFTKNDITYMLIEVNLSDYTLEDMENYLKQRGYENLGNLSNFEKGENPEQSWNGQHDDYLFKKI